MFFPSGTDGSTEVEEEALDWEDGAPSVEELVFSSEVSLEVLGLVLVDLVEASDSLEAVPDEAGVPPQEARSRTLLARTNSNFFMFFSFLLLTGECPSKLTFLVKALPIAR